jgi:RNA-binding protein 5/10
MCTRERRALSRSLSPCFPACSLVVNGLAAGTEESSLYLRLAGVVSVKAVRLVVQPAGVEASGPFALVDLHSVDDARRVKSLLDGAPEVDGGSLAVEFTREPPTSWLSNGGRGGAAAAAIAAARSASQYGNSSGAHADVPVWAPAEFKEGETDEQQAGAAVAAEAGYVLDPESGYYYDVSSGLYYDGNTGLFYNGHTQQWYSYDANTQQYTSYVASTRKASVKESAVSAVSAVTIGNKKQHSEAMELWNQRKQEEQEDAPTTSPAVPGTCLTPVWVYGTRTRTPRIPSYPSHQPSRGIPP